MFFARFAVLPNGAQFACARAAHRSHFRRDHMSVSRCVPLIPCIVLAALSSYACDDGNVTRIGPTPVNARSRFVNAAVAVRPFEISPVIVPGGLCPTVPPLLAPVNVVISADRTTDLQLRQVQLQFVDATGTIGGFRSFDDLALTGLFGSTVIPALGTRTFPLSLPFGCVGGLTGALSVTAITSDMLGRDRRTTMQVPIR